MSRVPWNIRGSHGSGSSSSASSIATTSIEGRARLPPMARFPPLGGTARSPVDHWLRLPALMI
jgi:hypothetical protein